MSAPVQNSTSPVTSTPNPEIKAVEQRVDQAGYARNRKEAIYKQAVKDHGADSEQAVTAKAELTQAQAEVEKQQGELRKLFKVSAAPAPAPAAPKPQQSEFKAIFETLREEFRPQTQFLERSVRIFSDQESVHKLPKFDPKKLETLEKLKKEIESGKIKIEDIIAPHGEVLLMKAPPHAAYLEALPERPAPAEKK